MLLNPIIAMLHNTTTDRWHPIVFCEAPLPSCDIGESPVRHKSSGHHTTGFATRDEALAACVAIKAQMQPEAIGDIQECLDKAFPWDGDGVPAMVVFFQEANGAVVPALF